MAGDENTKKISGPLVVFLCYSEKDIARVGVLYNLLKAEKGIKPWFAKQDSIPGKMRQFETRKIIQDSDIVVVCLSQSSIIDKGNLNKEVKYALDVADEYSEGNIFIIPAKLEECNIPIRLTDLNSVNLFEEGGYGKLKKALKIQAEKLGIEITLSNIDTLPSTDSAIALVDNNGDNASRNHGTQQGKDYGELDPLGEPSPQVVPRFHPLLFGLCLIAAVTLLIPIILLASSTEEVEAEPSCQAYTEIRNAAVKNIAILGNIEVLDDSSGADVNTDADDPNRGEIAIAKLLLSNHEQIKPWIVDSAVWKDCAALFDYRLKLTRELLIGDQVEYRAFLYVPGEKEPPKYPQSGDVHNCKEKLTALVTTIVTVINYHVPLKQTLTIAQLSSEDQQKFCGAYDKTGQGITKYEQGQSLDSVSNFVAATRQYKDAEEILKESIGLFKTDSTSHYYLGLVYLAEAEEFEDESFKNQKYHDATDEFKEAVRLSTLALYTRAVGRAYFRLSDYDSAIEWFTKAIDAQSGYILAYNSRSQAYREKNDYLRAKQDLESITPGNPKSNPEECETTAICRSWGILEYKMRNPALAIKILDRALTKDKFDNPPNQLEEEIVYYLTVTRLTGKDTDCAYLNLYSSTPSGRLANESKRRADINKRKQDLGGCLTSK